MRIAVLAYHAQNANGQGYHNNDHIALAQDLDAIRAAGVPLLSLSAVIHALRDGRAAQLPEAGVCLSCDDGTSLDWEDYDHPTQGHQRAFANLLRDHLAQENPTNSDARNSELLTAFVIASPAARAAIDAGCYEGIPLSDDRWWPIASAEGLLRIENHSWDHLHAVIPERDAPQCEAGNFYSVNTYAAADRQVRLAAAQIDQLLPERSRPCELFAYPYGHCSEYLAGEYFPQHSQEHGVIAAFSTEPTYLESDTDLYRIGRFVCGDAWQSPDGFAQILAGLNPA